MASWRSKAAGAFGEALNAEKYASHYAKRPKMTSNLVKLGRLGSGPSTGRGAPEHYVKGVRRAGAGVAGLGVAGVLNGRRPSDGLQPKSSAPPPGEGFNPYGY